MKPILIAIFFLFVLPPMIHAGQMGDQIPFKSLDDPFVGTFTMNLNGQIAGTVIITHTSGNNYKVDTGNGFDFATRSGEMLQGTTEGYPFTIVINGNNLTMDLVGTKINLIRVDKTVTPSASDNRGSIDRRLIGVWRNGYTHNSGNAGSSSQTLIAFLENGTFEYQESYTAGGSGWSGVSQNDPVQKGTYSILTITSDGGTINLNGQVLSYEIYVFQGEQKMSLGNYKTPWLKIR